MSLRKKIFGSLFVLACIGVVVAVVLLITGSKGTDPSEMVVPEPTTLPEIDLSLTEMDRTIVPDISLPDTIGTTDVTIDITGPDIDIGTSGIVSFTPDPMPGVSFDIAEFQELMESIVSQ